METDTYLIFIASLSPRVKVLTDSFVSSSIEWPPSELDNKDQYFLDNPNLSTEVPNKF